MASPEQPAVAPPADVGGVNVVETPTSPSSAFTLSRFEFEAGTKGNEGTKILMVEWDARAATDAAASSGGADGERELAQNGCDDWDVTWEGKGPDGGKKDEDREGGFTVLPIRDTDAPEGSRRVYFLLPPGAPIPTLVTISKRTGLTELRTKPLPAIFPEGLVSEDKGTRGVLHTIWAKRRLRELEAEIAAEMRDNSESVGLEMVLQERQWIVDHFGLEIDTSSEGAIPPVPQNPDSSSPVSPRSPIGGRLGERLKGLKLATSPAELAAAKEGKPSFFSFFFLCFLLPLSPCTVPVPAPPSSTRAVRNLLTTISSIQQATTKQRTRQQPSARLPPSPQPQEVQAWHGRRAPAAWHRWARSLRAAHPPQRGASTQKRTCSPCP